MSPTDKSSWAAARWSLLGLSLLAGGCLAATGSITALIVGSNNGGSDKEPPPPDGTTEVEATRSPGPFQILEGEAIAVALADFIPQQPSTSSPTPSQEACLDAAVIFKDRRIVTFFQGDCTGRLIEQSTVLVNGQNTLAIASVSLASGISGLLVVTSQTLELILHDQALSALATTAFVPFAGEDLKRDLVVGDFDADGSPDAAVTSFDQSVVKIYRISPAGDSLQESRVLPLTVKPLSITSSNFYPDPEGRSDIGLLVDDGGHHVLELHFARQDGSWCSVPDVSLPLPEPAHRLARGHELRLDPGSTPDLALIRADGTSTDLVKRCGNDDLCVSECDGSPTDVPALLGCGPPSPPWFLEHHNRGAGHFSPAAQEIIMMPLPGNLGNTLDRVTIDSGLESIICSYHRDVLELDSTVTYSLPWKGTAMAAGDLNADGLADLVATCSESGLSQLVTLVANAPFSGAVTDPAAYDVTQDPFYYYSGARCGERPRGTTAVLDIGFGFASANNEPFIAAVDRTNAELSIFFLGQTDFDKSPALFSVEKEERHAGLVRLPASVGVFDFNGRGGDDIAVSGRDALYYLENLDGFDDDGMRFAEKEFTFSDLVSQDELRGPALSDMQERDFRFRMRDLIAGPLDGARARDILIPVTIRTPQSIGDTELSGLICVVLNVGSSEERKVRFYDTLPSPRSLALTNLNGDTAVDLLVACDGDTDKVHMLFGNIEEPGTFFDQPTDPLPPRELVGPSPSACGLEEVEEVATAASALLFMKEPPPILEWPLAEWIVATNENTVTMYCREECPDDPGLEVELLESRPQSRSFSRTRKEAPCFTGPHLLSTATTDPEAILVYDLFEGGDDPDLAIVDEAAHGNVVYFKSTTPRPDGCPDWDHEGIPTTVGSPQRVVPFRTSNGVLHLAVASRSQQDVQLLRREDSLFKPAGKVEVPRKNRPGSRVDVTAATACFKSPVVALLAEDSEDDGAAAVDLIMLGEKEPASSGRIELGSLWNQGLHERLLLGGAGLPEGILAGCFMGNDCEADLLTFIPSKGSSGTIQCFPGTGAHRKGDRGGKVFGPGTVLIESIEGDLVDWEAVRISEDEDWLGVATSSEIQLFSGSAARWRSEGTYDPVRMAFGWSSPARGPESGLFCGIIETNSLSVEPVISGLEPVRLGLRESKTILFDGRNNPALRLGEIGCRDVNKDGKDDIVVVEGGRSVHVFLLQQGGPELRFEPARSLDYPGFYEPVDLGFLDSNGDGFTDVCFGSRNGEVLVFHGNGRGSLGSPGILYAAPEFEGLKVADLDGDGRDEILAAVDLPGLIVFWPR